MSLTAAAKLIVALDTRELRVALELIERLTPLDVWFKVGYEPLFGFGDALRAKLEALGANVFVDAKLHDIPRTVEAAVRALVRPGVRILSVHALGGKEMLAAAVAAAAERADEFAIEVPKIFAVTLLTSIGSEELDELGLRGGADENVMRLAALAQDARCAGVICSPHEVRDLKAGFGTRFEVLCPGIRPAGSAHGDQKRVATPEDAVAAGADYLVVGRPIAGMADPVAAARAILAQMESARAR